MVYKIIFKKRFLNKLEQVLIYIEGEFGYLISRQFAEQIEKKLITLQQQPHIGKKSFTFPDVRSIPAGKQNRFIIV